MTIGERLCNRQELKDAAKIFDEFRTYLRVHGGRIADVGGAGSLAWRESNGTTLPLRHLLRFSPQRRMRLACRLSFGLPPIFGHSWLRERVTLNRH